MTKTVFFTDLDRTMIYSSFFLDPSIPVEVVETIDGLPNAYMTPTAVSGLREVLNRCLVIPVTTRTWAECQRITWIRDGLLPVVICDNGASIYVRGKRDEDWQNHIRKEREKLSPVVEFVPTFQELLLSRGLKTIRVIENLFLRMRFESMNADLRETLHYLSIACEKKGYRIFVSGRKAYLLPLFLGKETATAYMEKKYDIDFTIAAGDASLDVAMLRRAHFSLSPGHRSFDDPGIFQMPEEGLLAGERMVEWLKTLCEKDTFVRPSITL